MVTELREGRLLELVNLVIDAHGSRVAKVLYRRHRDDKLALVRALAAAAGVGIEQPGRAFRDADQVTILTGRGRAAKLITPGGIDSYAAGRWFAVTTVEVRGIAELASVLRQLERAPYSFIIRAKLIEGLDPKCVRRLLHADQASGEGPYFEPCPRRWVGLDFDGLDLPIGVSAVDLDAVAGLAVAKLPEPFRRTSSWAQSPSTRTATVIGRAPTTARRSPPGASAWPARKRARSTRSGQRRRNAPTPRPATAACASSRSGAWPRSRRLPCGSRWRTT